MFLKRIFLSLNKAKVRYLVVGGVAGVLYGNPRFTNDLDLIADMEDANLDRLIRAFKTLKLVPRAPVRPEEFLSAENRKRWLKEKGMLAFTFINPNDPIENTDILMTHPLSFEKAYKSKKIFKLGNIAIPTVSRHDLIIMKKKAGRPQDLADITILQAAIKRKKYRK